MATTDSSRPCWQMTASEALPLLHNGTLSVEDYTKSLLQRIWKQDQKVKAWAYINPSQVLGQAQALDRVPAAQRGPLHGLPIGVKDVILTKDMPTQYNSRLYETEEPMTVDAACIISLRAAGALIMGKTTTTEFASSKQGNWHQNLTTNARDSSRTPGGSSSGSGAAVADMQVPIALGTQTGGSIMRPASFNGCYGLKPTWGALSREGIATWSITLDTLGFFSRSVEDLDPLMDLFRIQDDESISPQAFKLRGAKIAVCRSPNWSKAGPGTQKAMARAKEILQAHGAEVDDLELPSDFNKILEWHAVVLGMEGKASFLGQYLTGRELLHGDIAAHVENRKQYTRKDQLEAYDNCARLRPVFDDIAKQYDVILTPSVVDEAPATLEHTGDMSFNSMWTMLHVPCLNLPGFAGESGLPIGLTATTARYRDRHLLHVGKTLGAVFGSEGGWEPSKEDERSGKPGTSGLRSF